MHRVSKKLVLFRVPTMLMMSDCEEDLYDFNKDNRDKLSESMVGACRAIDR